MNSPRRLPDPKPVKFSCGHARPLREVENDLCNQCRNEKRKAFYKASRAKQELKKENAATFRFPAETEFQCRWTGEVWKGMLAVPGLPTIVHEHSNLHTMQREMKSMYESRK